MKKNKKKKTTAEQFIDDLISSGIPLAIELKKYFEENKNKLKEVDERFYSHIYPNKNLKWTKKYINLEIYKIISPSSFLIFDAISNLINKNNLVQISQKEIIEFTECKNKRTVSKSLKELIEKGFIAIKLKGNTKRNNIYMINPEITTIGKGNQEKLKKEFWKLTGSIYELGILKEPSKIHNFWLDLQENQSYIIGYDKIQINDEIISFNKLSERKITQKKSSVNYPKYTDENKQI